MLDSLWSGLTLGLATGTTCLVSCGPVYGAFLLSERRRAWESLRVVLLLNVGRFIAYLLFGLLIGALGGSMPASLRVPLAHLGYILFSFYLLLSVRRASQSCRGCAPGPLARWARSPFALGFLTGFSICPAFLIALTGAFGSSGALSGMVLFGGFFAGTSVYMLPFAFAGLLTRKPQITSLARVLAVLVALYFGSSGAWGLYRHFFPGGPQVQPAEQALPADWDFSVAEADSLLLLYAPADSLDHGAELARALELSELPAVVLRELAEKDWRRSLESLPRGGIVIGPAWLDPRAEADTEAWQDSLRDVLRDGNLRIFAIDYEPFCGDFARSLAETFRGYRFQCSRKRGGRWLLQNPRGCAASDCATCSIPHDL